MKRRDFSTEGTLEKCPLVSIMLCVYNAQKYIKECMDSILAQTYANIEIIIVDDGSEDNTLSLIDEYDDTRILVKRNKHNYISSLNKGLKACKGKYVARIDADDIMAPNRIESQVAMMEKDETIDACFTWASIFGAMLGQAGTRVSESITDPLLTLLAGNVFVHSSAMLKNAFVKENAIKYSKGFPYAEDYKMWKDIADAGGNFYVVPELLVHYRTSCNQVSCVHRTQQEASRIAIQQEILEQLISAQDEKYMNKFQDLYNSLIEVNQLELLQGDDIIGIFYKLLKNIQQQKVQTV